MQKQIVVQRNRDNSILVRLGVDISADTFTSQIRVEENWTSTLLATWTCGFLTDGIDGDLLLTLDQTITSEIVEDVGYMDIKRSVNSEVGSAVSVFGSPIQVKFQGTVTA